MASKQYFSLNLVAACAVTLIILSGCKTEELVNDGLGTGGTGSVSTPAPATPTPSPTVTPTPTPVPADYDAEAYFLLESAWDQAPNNATSHVPVLVNGSVPPLPLPTACLIPFGEAPAPGNAAALTHSCMFQIPEAQLYFSALKMRMGSSDSVNCHYIKFYPYYYEINGPTGVAVIAPGTTPTPAPIAVPWTTGAAPPPPISCYGFAQGTNLPVESGVPTTEATRLYSTPGCYNGPATLVPSFPFITSLLSETQYSQQLTFAVGSANTKNQYSNRWASNDSLAIGAAGPSVSGEYLLSSMHGYTLQCLNEFGILTYQTKIVIGAELDTSGAAATTYKSWR